MFSYTHIYNLVDRLSNRPTPSYLKPTLDINYNYTPVEIFTEDSIETSWGFPKGEGNINYGGDNARQAHIAGAYKHIDCSAKTKKSWVDADERRLNTAETFKQSMKKYREENYEKFLAQQRAKNKKSVLAKAKRISYNGKVYLGWREFTEMTGITQYYFIKDNLGEVE